jgi:hypothetical protein
MKKILLFVFILSLALLCLLFVRKSYSPKLPIISPPTITVSDTVKPKNISPIPETNRVEINYGDQLLEMVFYRIDKNANVILIPNFAKKDFSQIIAESAGCDFAINGGFYNESGKPLGYFKVDGIVYGNVTESSIANGFFTEDESGIRHIGKSKPINEQNYQFILQTGPFLPVGDYKVKMVTDEKARRSMLLTDSSDNLYISVLYEKDAVLSGPFLSDLPAILSSVNIQKKITFRNLLNLDGGAASFFFIEGKGDNFVLPELLPVGSVICIKQ